MTGFVTKAGRSLGKPIFKFLYDFAIHDGAIGSIVLGQPDGPLPDNFIIQNAFIEVITPLDSAGAATAALTTGEDAGDLVAATAFDAAPWESAGLKTTPILPATLATWLKLTEERAPALVVAVAALTEGAFALYVEGTEGS